MLSKKKEEYIINSNIVLFKNNKGGNKIKKNIKLILRFKKNKGRKTKTEFKKILNKNKDRKTKIEFKKIFNKR